MESMSMDASAYDMIADCCLDDANSPAVWGLQRDLVDALRDHSTLTVEQVHEALVGLLTAVAWYGEEVRPGRLPGAFDPSLN